MRWSGEGREIERGVLIMENWAYMPITMWFLAVELGWSALVDWMVDRSGHLG